VSDKQEGSRIAEILGNKRAAFLQNHGLLTVGKSVEAAAWLFLTMERCCKAQILVESVGTPIRISDKIAEETREFTGSNDALIAAFHPVSELIGIRHAEVFE
jgi:ribulose-5-phosphate 4-epimerase/fuculose-1-phosphate aldolase